MLLKLNSFNWVGGKASHLNFLYGNFPSDFHHYVDVFGGSGVVLLNKERSPIETYNDVNQNVVTFYKMLRDYPDELIERIQLSPYSRREFEICISILMDSNSVELERARAFFVVANQSFHSRINTQATSNWKMCVKDSTTRGSSAVSKYLSKIERLGLIAERFKSVQIENSDFSKIFDKYDSDVSFFYVDPPYPLATRNSKKLYDFELSDERHVELLEIVNAVEGAVLISSFSSELYDLNLTGWIKSIDREKRIRSSSLNRKAAEVLYRNYEIQKCTTREAGYV
ncbi:MAG: DNA adenine methylase [Methanosarcinales archaeon]|jgi:DNA adenine methylase|nr:DNA adenine methylase [Methanosarcinales archaeon]